MKTIIVYQASSRTAHKVNVFEAMPYGEGDVEFMLCTAYHHYKCICGERPNNV